MVTLINIIWPVGVLYSQKSNIFGLSPTFSLTVSVETSVTPTLFSIEHGVQFTPFAPAVCSKAF